jgi:hypothetical protein
MNGKEQKPRLSEAQGKDSLYCTVWQKAARRSPVRPSISIRLASRFALPFQWEKQPARFPKDGLQPGCLNVHRYQRRAANIPHFTHCHFLLNPILRMQPARALLAVCASIHCDPLPALCSPSSVLQASGERREQEQDDVRLV